MVDLDGARADDRDGGEPGGGLRGDRADPRGQRAAGTGCTRSRGACCGGAAARGAARAGGGADLGQQELLEHDQRADREDRGERLVGLAQVRLEGGAAVAAAHVAARRRAQAPQALGDLAELLAHLLAVKGARLGGLGERDTRAHEQRLHRRDGGLHRLGDLVVAERVDLAQQQRRALRLGQRLDVLEQLADRLAALDVLDRGLAVVGEVHVHRVDADRLLAAQMVQRAVARDPVQPRAHVDRALVGEQRVERGREDLLQHVLGVLLGGEHVPAEGEQARLVAGDERLIGGLVALAGQRDEPLVALQAQQRRRTSYAEVWMFECGGFHARGRTGAVRTLSRRTPG